MSVSASTVLPAGSYSLKANFMPANPLSYTAASATMSFTSKAQNVFISNAGGSVTSLTNAGTVQSGATGGGGVGLAVDSTGSVWSINASGFGVSKFDRAGTLITTYSGAGMSSGAALAVDGLGTVWVANGNGSVSAWSNSGVAGGAAGLSGAVGTAGNISQPTSIQVDSAGSLWIANAGNDTVTEMIGAAAPVTTPALLGVLSGTPGTRP